MLVALLAACVRRGLKVLSATGAGARADPTRIRVADLRESTNDPLSRSVMLFSWEERSPYRWEVVSRPREMGEIDLLQRLMSSIHSVLLSPSSSDSRAWSLSSSGSFSVKSFFYALSRDSNPLMFLPAKFLWSSKVPSKVKALAWLVAHGKEMESPIDHLFLHCPVTIGLWHRLFNLVGVIWVPPRSIEDMLVISFKGLGNSVRGKILWQIACLTLIWMVWQERNNRIFEDKGERKRWLGFDSVLLVSMGFCTEAFRGVPLSILQINWIGEGPLILPLACRYVEAGLAAATKIGIESMNIAEERG
ncbi:hypothetical protein CK203_087473 [Vitis vinifera]|uniref:Reverse transcriptase zinc-binding domain-containing protein n=1 Tax=Vitis vinifera TaxID=29760 RepID=A0A438ENA6_VITVI|nr:hypothetical protein CK203_087473 [Vitis vinifera]